MLRRMVGLVAVVFVVNCGGDSDDKATSTCRRILSTICDKYVECHVTVNGMVFTPAICQQGLPSVVQQCVTDDGAEIMAATDAAIETCIQDLDAFACSALCGQIPQDPPSCQMIGGEQSTEMVTCQP